MSKPLTMAEVEGAWESQEGVDLDPDRIRATVADLDAARAEVAALDRHWVAKFAAETARAEALRRECDAAATQALSDSRRATQAEAALRESQARVEEYRREVERRDELLAGADADLRESQAREAALVESIRVAIFMLERQVRAVQDITGLPYVGYALDGPTPEAVGLRAALASPSDAAVKLLERVEKAELAAKHLGNAADMTAQDLDDVEADRDRWLVHCRALMRFMDEGYCVSAQDVQNGVNAARRDLEQHDAGRGK